VPAPTRRGDLAELPARSVRVDIQGLRAIAVLLVLAFHLYPDRIVGGFIGVDVFFVVSGFLITSHLVRTPPRRPADVAQFWGRRIRRLLPASLTVIVATVIAGCIFLPVSQLASLGRDALAATLYVENWNLAASAVDYLAIGSAPSPLQHYWSLGVEEQFYLLWPLLIAFAAWLVRRTGRDGRTPLATFAIVLGVFVTASFVASVIWTALEPAAAYFVTPTRLWELGVGGLIAVWSLSATAGRRDGLLREAVRTGAAWLGLVLIAFSAVAISSESPFPGWIAVLPVGGTALFLAADADNGRRAPVRLLGWRPIQFLGDTSYSIYLWHYPLIVLGAAALGAPLTIVWKIAIVLATIGLAWLTKVFIENPVRTGTWFRTPVRRTYLLAAAVTVIAIAVSFAAPVRVAAVSAQAAADRQKIIEANVGCFGADALVNDGCIPHGTEGVIPSPATARQEDVATAYADGCFEDKPFSDAKTCVYGDPATAAHTIALVGNSHGAQWLPALQALIDDEDLAITTFVASGCPPTTARVVFDTDRNSAGCHDWAQRVVDATSHDDFDLVVITAASNSDVVGVDPADKFGPQTDGYAGLLQAWADVDQQVLVIRDTPIPFFDIPDCVAGHPVDLSACDGERSTWETPDPMVAAAEQIDSDRVRVVDLNGHFCDASTCYAVLGGVLVYFDYMHAGATFIRTTAPYLAPALREGFAAADR